MARRTNNDAPDASVLPPEWLEIIQNLDAGAGSAVISRKRNGQSAYLESVGVAAISSDPHAYLKDRFGGGEFSVRLKDQAGQYIKGSSIKIVIEGREKFPDEEPAAAPNTELEAKLIERIERAEGGTQAMMLAMIREQGENARAALANRQAGPDPVELAVSMMSAMSAANAPLIAALVERGSEKPNPLESIEMLTALLQLTQQMGAKEEGFGSLVKTLGEPIAKLVDAHVSAPAQGANPGAGAPAPAPGGVPRPAWYPLLAPTMPALLTWARDDRSPELRAELVLEELTDDQLGVVHNTLMADSFNAEFFRHIPQAAPFRPWFDRFFAAVLSGIIYEDDGAPFVPRYPSLPEGEGPEGDEPEPEPADNDEGADAGAEPGELDQGAEVVAGAEAPA